MPAKRDLLRKLRSVRSTERAIVPDPVWVSRTRSALIDEARRSGATAPFSSFARIRAFFGAFVPMRAMQFVRTPVLATLSIFAALLGGSFASVSAAERSLPGDFLYPIKIAGEQTRLAFTQDKADRVRLKAEFVDRRVDEIRTIVNTPSKNDGNRVRDAAIVLKRDLDTMKNQLKEVNRGAAAPKAAELAKLVDQKTEHISQELKHMKIGVSADAKQAMAEAEAQAVQTSVAAVVVLIEAKDKPESQSTTTDLDVATVLQNKIRNLQTSVDALVTNEEFANSLTMVRAALDEVRALIDENRLNAAADKFAEAAKAFAAVEASVDASVATDEPVATAATSDAIAPVSGTSTEDGADASSASSSSSQDGTSASSTSAPTPP